jgi:very-short-patch-repair endonuclease
VDVDGGAYRNSRAADRRRDERLERLGCRVVRVVRVDAAVVSRSIEAGVALVHAALSKSLHVGGPSFLNSGSRND